MLPNARRRQQEDPQCECTRRTGSIDQTWQNGYVRDLNKSGLGEILEAESRLEQI